MSTLEQSCTNLSAPIHSMYWSLVIPHACTKTLLCTSNKFDTITKCKPISLFVDVITLILFSASSFVSLTYNCTNCRVSLLLGIDEPIRWIFWPESQKTQGSFPLSTLWSMFPPIDVKEKKKELFDLKFHKNSLLKVTSFFKSKLFKYYGGVFTGSSWIVLKIMLNLLNYFWHLKSRES